MDFNILVYDPMRPARTRMNKPYLGFVDGTAMGENSEKYKVCIRMGFYNPYKELRDIASCSWFGDGETQ